MTRSGSPSDPETCLLFGEVLFDHFPDGRQTLGGAPFNVAWHLEALGARPVLLSRIGNDREGDRVLRAMEDWGLSTAGIQRDPENPTGRVRVALDGDDPTFHIEPEQAWDFVDPYQAARVADSSGTELVYHGTLATRLPTSSRALDRTLEAVPEAAVFVDLNLRPPWWDRDGLLERLRDADVCKLNAEELRRIQETDGEEELSRQTAQFRGEHDLERVWLTRGDQGALTVGEEGRVMSSSAPRVEEMEDSVGAGDAFAAVTLLGILQGWEPERTLGRAVSFAAELCRHRGATPESPDLYREILDRWETEG